MNKDFKNILNGNETLIEKRIKILLLSYKKMGFETLRQIEDNNKNEYIKADNNLGISDIINIELQIIEDKLNEEITDNNLKEKFTKIKNKIKSGQISDIDVIKQIITIFDLALAIEPTFTTVMINMDTKNNYISVIDDIINDKKLIKK